MLRSCHEENRRLLEAYEHFKTANYEKSLQIYESLLETTFNSQMRLNVICTMSVILISLGRFDKAVQLLEQNVMNLNQNQVSQSMELIHIRYMSNLCLCQIMKGDYEQGLQSMKNMRQLVQRSQINKDKIMNLICMMFFRVQKFEDIGLIGEIKLQVSLLQAYCMLNLGFAKYLCNFQGAKDLFKSAYPIFIAHNQFHLAIVCLKQILLLPLLNKEIHKYNRELHKIQSILNYQETQLQHDNKIKYCQIIANQLLQMNKSILLNPVYPKFHQNTNLFQKNIQYIWKTVLNSEQRKVKTIQIPQEERDAILKNIDMMRYEKNPIILKEMMKMDFFVAGQREIGYLINSFVNICQRIHRKELTICFNLIAQKCTRTSMIKNKYFERHQMGKQNIMIPVTMTRDRSSKSLIGQIKKPVRSLSQISLVSPRPPQTENSKMVLKMLKFCEYGSFLNKRNFHSDGGQYRFVRITQSVLKWAKNPQKIEQSCKLYPLKDVRAIIYGKCSPVMLKSCNQLLTEQNCFSLRINKRTFDFHCKDFEQACNWVCGLSQKLHQINPKIKVYTVGRMLWKKMFMKLRQKFTNKIKFHERNYFYETAHAIILFGKNGYKLPNN